MKRPVKRFHLTVTVEGTELESGREGFASHPQICNAPECLARRVDMIRKFRDLAEGLVNTNFQHPPGVVGPSSLIMSI
jgi:hypothetical protein